jgi:sulfur-carrier protein
MSSIEIAIPSILSDCAGGRTRLTIEAATVGGALEQLRRQFPLLRVHLFDESARTRRHLLIFYNDQNIAWLDSLDVALKPGDQLSIVQAVSGG